MTGGVAAVEVPLDEQIAGAPIGGVVVAEGRELTGGRERLVEEVGESEETPDESAGVLQAEDGIRN
jgi:hypothetical protein